MARRKKGNKVDGWINLNKPLGLTSTQALGKVRRYLNAQKAGHAGTLDPLASGVLPIALGEATKTIPYMQDRLKTYRFEITWGEARDTDDAEGAVIARSDVRPSVEDIQAALPDFTGDIEQIPPKFSAIKVDGARAYDLARDGEVVELKPRVVYIKSLKLLSHDQDTAQLRMVCGKGTYVRSLARDLAEKLGTHGYISLLERAAVGGFSLDHAISLEFLENMSDSAAANQALKPLHTVLDDIPALEIEADEMARLRNGQTVILSSRPGFERLKQAGLGAKDKTITALALHRDNPVALVEGKGPTIKSIRVFNL